MNTLMVRPTCFDRVFNLSSMFKLIKQRGRKQKTDTDQAHIPKEKLLEYVYDTIPELKGKKISEPQGWKCPDQVLPLPMFSEGDLVVWNDIYIPPTHGLRVSLKDEGPFTVRIVDDFIVALVGDGSGKLTTKAPKLNRITVETPTGRALIAHPGYFKLFRE